MSTTPIPTPADLSPVPGFAPESNSAPVAVQPPSDLLAEELRRQVLATVREFGPRKYQVFYAKAKHLAEDLRPDAVRRDLIGAPPAPPPMPEGGLHFLTSVNYEQ